jgi:hypothetical protein
MPAVVNRDEPPHLLDAFRKQVRGQIDLRGPDAGWAVVLAWEGQRGVDRDDLIDIVKEELGLIPPFPPAQPGGTGQKSPFG